MSKICRQRYNLITTPYGENDQGYFETDCADFEAYNYGDVVCFINNRPVPAGATYGPQSNEGEIITDTLNIRFENAVGVKQVFITRRVYVND